MVKEMISRWRIVWVPLLIAFALIFYIVTRERMALVFTLSMAIEGIPLVARDLKPKLVPKVVTDAADFIGFSILYWLWLDPTMAQSQMDTALGVRVPRVPVVLLYLGMCVHFAYKVYVWFKGRRQSRSE